MAREVWQNLYTIPPIPFIFIYKCLLIFEGARKGGGGIEEREAEGLKQALH